MSQWRNIILGIFLWLLRQALSVYNPLLADAVMLAWPIYLVWQVGFLGPWFSLLIASWLVDILTFSVWPVYTIATFLSGIIYRQFIEDFLAESSALCKGLNMFAWLLIWRLIRWFILALAWRFNIPGFLPTTFAWSSWLNWLMYSALVLIVLSWLWRLVLKLIKRFKYA